MKKWRSYWTILCYVGWRRGVVVSGVHQWTKLTHVGPGYNWDGWPSSGGYTISGCNQPTRSTQPCIPPGSLNRVPASAGVKAGMSPLRVEVTLCDPIWHVSSRSGEASANCYMPTPLYFMTQLFRFAVDLLYTRCKTNPQEDNKYTIMHPQNTSYRRETARHAVS